MAGVARERAVEGKRARAVYLELECRRAARGDALDDAVGVNREAVSDVVAADGQLDEIVLHDLDARGRELEVLRDNREFAPVGRLILGRAERGSGQQTRHC